MGGVAISMRSSVPADMVSQVRVDVKDMTRNGEDFDEWEVGDTVELPLKVIVPIFGNTPMSGLFCVDVILGRIYRHTVGVTIAGENAEIAGQYILAQILPGQSEEASWLRLWIKDW